MRYKSLLKSTYPQNNTYVRSYHNEVYIESTQALLLGLYPPGTGSIILSSNPEKIKPPIYVRKLNETQKKLDFAALPDFQRVISMDVTGTLRDSMNRPHENCQSYKNEEKHLSDDIDDLEIKYESFYRDIVDYVHPPDGKSWSSELCYKLNTDLLSAVNNGENPSFANDLEIAKKLSECARDYCLYNLLGGELRPKLMSFSIIDGIRTQFNQAKNHYNGYKLSIYVMTDLHILSILKFFDFDIERVPVHASSLMIELYNDSSIKGADKYRVQISYNNKTFKLQNDLEYSENFLQYINDYTYENKTAYLRACHRIPSILYDRSFYSALSILLLMLFLTIWGTSWFIILTGDKPNNEAEEITLNY